MKWDRCTKGENKGLKSAIFLVCGAVITTSILSGAGLSEQKSLESLLRQRTDIIQMVWYSQMTREEGEKRLKQIETHPLLGEDVAWLRKAEEGMEFSYVLDMEILQMERTSRSSAGTCYGAEILWNLEEYNQHVSEIKSYRIRTVNQSDGTMLLSEFQPILDGRAG